MGTRYWDEISIVWFLSKAPGSLQGQRHHSAASITMPLPLCWLCWDWGIRTSDALQPPQASQSVDVPQDVENYFTELVRSRGRDLSGATILGCADDHCYAATQGIR